MSTAKRRDVATRHACGSAVAFHNGQITITTTDDGRLHHRWLTFERDPRRVG